LINCLLSFDFDAESGFLFREPERAKRSLAGLEERRFGPRVGVDRILRMLDRLKLRSTFYIPAWTVQHYPQECLRIRDAGHEIAAHGNVHETLDVLDREQEEAIMQVQLQILSGRASRIALLEELVAFMRRSRRVWFATCEEVARWHESRRGHPLQTGGDVRKGRDTKPIRPGSHRSRR
jgi:hypothetical protein